MTKEQNWIRPDYRKPYKPGEISRKFFSWVNVNLVNEGTITPKFHYQMVDELLTEHTEVQAMVFRGGAKSTVFTKFLPLYIASTGELPNFGHVTNLVIFSATYQQAVDLLKDLRSSWENSDVLQDTLKLAKNKNGKIIADKESHVCFENDKGQRTHIQIKGANDSMRGIRVEGKRIELMILDDILKDNIMDSAKEREKLKRWYYSSVVPAVDPSHNKKIVVGTPMTDDDLLMEMLRSKTYKSVKFPICEQFPVPLDEIIPAWGDFHTKEVIMNAYLEAKEMGGVEDFFREKMLEVVNEEMRVFKDEWIKYYSYEDMKRENVRMNFFTSIDLAVSKKKSGDTSAVITIGVNEYGHRFIVAAKRGRMTPGEVINELFNQVRKFNPLDVRAEKAALQQVLDYFIEQEQHKRKIYFQTNYLERNSVESKEYRIKSMQPLFKQGKWHFPNDVDLDGVEELLYELRGYTRDGPTTRHQDMIDCLANFMDPNFVIEPMGHTGSEINGDMYSLEDVHEHIDTYDF